MEFVKAGRNDLPGLWRLYESVCAAQEGSAYSPGWHLGIYPAREDLLRHIEAGEMHLARAEQGIAAAAVLTLRDDPMYADAAWLSTFEGEDAGVIHLFAVHPTWRRRGVSDRMLQYLIACAQGVGKQTLRLDVVSGNLPAELLYRKHGFLFAEERQVYYEDTGDIRVRLMERILRE